jgi:AcrR family transcriptional regulator
MLFMPSPLRDQNHYSTTNVPESVPWLAIAGRHVAKAAGMWHKARCFDCIVSGETTQRMPTREQAKDQRRQDIVHAARMLMQKTGKTGFSMRTLAEEAGVSIATPYNLFGSKQAVMFAVLDADSDLWMQRLRRLKADEIDIFFKAVSLARTLYAAEAGFYKAVLFAAYMDGGTEFRSIFGGPRHAMWRSLVENAKQAGMLTDDLESNSFVINFTHIFFSCIMEWVNGLLTLEEMEARVQYGFALTLRGAATPACSERLLAKVLACQQRLKTLHRRKARAARANGHAQAGPED